MHWLGERKIEILKNNFWVIKLIFSLYTQMYKFSLSSKTRWKLKVKKAEKNILFKSKMIVANFKNGNWITRQSKKNFCLFLNVKLITKIKTDSADWQCKISIPLKNHTLPDGSIFFTIKEWEDYFQFLSQIGAHQTLHLNKKMVAARWYRRVFFSMTMLHLKISQKTQQSVWIKCKDLRTKQKVKNTILDYFLIPNF